MYLYATNVAIDEGRQQPVHLKLGDAMRLTDVHGTDWLVRFVEMIGNSSVVEHEAPPRRTRSCGASPFRPGHDVSFARQPADRHACAASRLETAVRGHLRRIPVSSLRSRLTGWSVRGIALASPLESFWSLMKRGYTGNCRKMSPKHLHGNVDEISGFHNVRGHDTCAMMEQLGSAMAGKRLRTQDANERNGLDSGACPLVDDVGEEWHRSRRRVLVVIAIHGGHSR